MDKEQILQKIQDCGIVAVVRAESVDKAIRITDACIEGGVAAIELVLQLRGDIQIAGHDAVFDGVDGEQGQGRHQRIFDGCRKQTGGPAVNCIFSAAAANLFSPRLLIFCREIYDLSAC